MIQTFTFSQFLSRFPDDDSCLEEIKKLRFPQGVYCMVCSKFTKHYRLTRRAAYSCQFCRNQVYPLAGTLFDKSSTSLRIWFYALFLMTQTRGDISVKLLERELGVTYKTAWRMFTHIRVLMEENNGDLLSELDDNDEIVGQGEKRVHRWTFFNKLEITVTQKEEKK